MAQKAGIRPGLPRRLKADIKAWLFLTPALVFIITFTVYPIVRSLWLGLNQLEMGMDKPVFVGLQNYAQLASDPLFWKVMRNSLVFSILTVFPSMVIGLSLAIIVNKDIRGVGFLRTAYFYPAVMPMIAIASTWMFIYMAQYGMLDQILATLGLKSLNVLSSKKTVLPALSLMYIWKEAGYLMIFFLSGLQNISGETYEAATLDGASPWTTFRKITFPLLMPTILFVSTIALTNSLKLVDHIVIMTEGAPNNASTLLLYYIYQQGFIYFDQGKASSLTVIMLAIMLSISMIQFIKTDKKIYYS
ncbi:MAG TPA: sugar ABC transporter permease [Rectinemataceae bacterium]|nr:sugar ABC transporter permease [Rectinemataceae bacterium]